MATDVSQLDMLEVVPDPFVRVQVWRLPRQLLQPELATRSLSQERLDGLITVDRGTIPDDQQLAADVGHQMGQEARHICAIERSCLHLHQQPPLRGDATDHREMIPRQWHIQNGAVPTPRVGPHPPRHQIQGGFVSPDDRAPFAPCLFLSAGQPSAYHAVLAASSRWVARWMGRCGLQPMWRRRRLTCPG